jgi:hypothetical protein
MSSFRSATIAVINRLDYQEIVAFLTPLFKLGLSWVVGQFEILQRVETGHSQRELKWLFRQRNAILGRCHRQSEIPVVNYTFVIPYPRNRYNVDQS